MGPNHGTLKNGTGFSAGKVGQAFAFDGEDDHIEVANEEAFDWGGGSFSILAWVRTLGGRAFSEHFLSKGNLWEGGDDYVLYVHNNEGRVVVEYRVPNSPLKSVSRVDDNDWHFIVVTQSGDCAGCSKLFVDGVLENTRDAETLANGDEPLVIGAVFSGGPLFAFKGSIDEVAVYNRALSAEEIQSIFENISAG